MQRKQLISLTVFFFLGVLVSLFLGKPIPQLDLVPVVEAAGHETAGQLTTLDLEQKPKGTCPLKHTDVKANISGFLARVTVTQEFINPFKEKIEAVYTFPLPHRAAVDDMTMRIGSRTIRGAIKMREEAQAIYQAARDNGYRAALLDQERPNIFTQSVANILPGESITVIISYVETLRYEEGKYNFVFPMMVGERYTPNQTGAEGAIDAARISPPRMRQGMRAGHDISIDVTLDAGVPLNSVRSATHELNLAVHNQTTAHASLRQRNVIPNQDFTLSYEVAGKTVTDAMLMHRAPESGYFTMLLQPPQRVAAPDVNPKELVFVLDTSGSMEGFPIEKAKECMTLALNNLYPSDTFNLITFAGDTQVLFPKPVPATPENLTRARKFLQSRNGSGGTEMMQAIRTALAPSDAPDHLRIVCFMTDGYVGNDAEILHEIRTHPRARVFSFGIGDSVNRYLLDGMAEAGRGEAEYVSLNADGSAAARRFHERIRNPLLTDISLDWGGLPVKDVYPETIPDLFSVKPVVVTGRFTGSGRGTLRLKGTMRGQPFVKEIPVVFPETEPNHDVLATLWARTRIGVLTEQLQDEEERDQARLEITELGLAYGLLTPFTSFVAVEDQPVTDSERPQRVDVPLEAPAEPRIASPPPDGVTAKTQPVNMPVPAFTPPKEVPKATPTPKTLASVKSQSDGDSTGVPGGVPGGAPGGVIGGVLGAVGAAEPPPPPPSREGTSLPPPSIVRRSEGVLRGTALNRAVPEYPSLAMTARASGDVVIEVVIDEVGTVAHARVISGHPLLQQGALAAARQWRFQPTMLNQQPVRVTGLLTFRFVLGETEGPIVQQPAQSRPDPERVTSWMTVLLPKAHPTIIRLLEWNKAAPGGAVPAKFNFVKNGKAEVTVTVKDLSPQTVAELKSLGFEPVGMNQPGKVVLGRIAIEHLAKLIQLPAVRMVSPM
ncbi:MAG: TonB family protein [Blastocatellia bacterium]|nr:TonB family protein [Blastocatellia bacterium]